ncbi:hypothetical protein REPUB_Repub09cG0205600 [Reevesia pubescens]
MNNPKESTDEKPEGKNSPQNTEERSGPNETNVTQTKGDAEKEGSGEDNVKGQGGGDIQMATPGDLDNEKNVSQTEKGEESGAGASGGGGGGSSASISVTRKRGRNVNPSRVGSSSGSGPKEKKKGEMEVPSSPPTCYVCQKTFASWKAVFGHLRAHPRPTPGAFPPPTFTPEGSPERNNKEEGDNLKEQLAPTLLNLARETMQKMSQDSNTTSVADQGVASSSGRGLDIDLNEPGTSVLLDLNDTPPLEKDDDDDDKD